MSHSGHTGIDGVNDFLPGHGYVRKYKDETMEFKYKDEKHEYLKEVQNLNDLVLSPQLDRHLNWVFDLETLGTKRNSIITEISAVAFDFNTNKVVSQLTLHLDIDEQVRAGRKISSSTLVFWLEQPKAASDKLKYSDKQFCKDKGFLAPRNILGALATLSAFLKNESAKWAETTGKSKEPLVWGNGISFDIGKIENLYEESELELPWQYWAERDARTLCDLAPDIKNAILNDFQGVKHFGLDDCINEMRYICAIHMQIKKASELLNDLKM